MNGKLPVWMVSVVGCAVMGLFGPEGGNAIAGPLAIENKVPAQAVAEPALKKGDRLVFLGDSITSQSFYTVLVANYILGAWPELELSVGQCALYGKTTAFFLKHAQANCIDLMKPTIVSSCYGRNDCVKGTPREYEQDTRKLIDIFRKNNARVMLATVPICGGNDDAAKALNLKIAAYADVGRRLAAETGCPLADFNGAMIQASEKMTRVRGGFYDIVARDGVHPDWHGHMAMAIAFLRGLGLGNREIARIEFDPAAGKATAGEGHKVIEVKGENVTVESKRFPLLFYKGHPSQALSDMWDIAEQMGFFDDLGRFMLVVKNLKPGHYAIIWSGAGGKVFTAEQLAKGVNLAHEFPQTPFQDYQTRLRGLVSAKLRMDNLIVEGKTYHRDKSAEIDKMFRTHFMSKADPNLDVATVAREEPARLRELADKSLGAVQVPIAHTILVTEVIPETQAIENAVKAAEGKLPYDKATPPACRLNLPAYQVRFFKAAVPGDKKAPAPAILVQVEAKTGKVLGVTELK